jgi:hypothetical protein
MPPESAENSFLNQAPSIALPNGGGAIRGIGEKFTANPGPPGFPFPRDQPRPMLQLSKYLSIDHWRLISQLANDISWTAHRPPESTIDY